MDNPMPTDTNPAGDVEAAMNDGFDAWWRSHKHSVPSALQHHVVWSSSQAWHAALAAQSRELAALKASLRWRDAATEKPERIGKYYVQVDGVGQPENMVATWGHGYSWNVLGVVYWRPIQPG